MRYSETAKFCKKCGRYTYAHKLGTSPDIIGHLIMDELTVSVEIDDALIEACRPFDYDFDGKSTFILPRFDAPKRDGTWSIGLICGPSGSGKTQLLKREYGVTKPPKWDGKKAIVSQVRPECLSAVGLNTIPSWCRPYHVLSNGEQYRADLARMIADNTAIDEFTSVVDRNVAKSCAYALQRYIRSSGINGVVLSSCHTDIIEWLSPDWVFDTAQAKVSPRGADRRPSIAIDIHECGGEWWGLFKDHHYLSETMNKSAKCFLGKINGETVCFGSVLAFPNQHFKSAFREHRTVVLPDFQGLGVGVRFSDAVAQHYVNNGSRFFSKTAHPRMGEYRERSPLWRGTSKNRKARLDYTIDRNTKERKYKDAHINRVCFSHEYIGGAA